MGEQKWDLLHSVMIAQPNRKKKDISSLLARTQPMKSNRLFITALPTFFSSLQMCSSLAMWGLACGLLWLQTLNCNFLLISNKPIFAGEISGSLFVSGQHFITLYLFFLTFLASDSSFVKLRWHQCLLYSVMRIINENICKTWSDKV